MCKNNDPDQPGLWVDRVDQKCKFMPPSIAEKISIKRINKIISVSTHYIIKIISRFLINLRFLSNSSLSIQAKSLLYFSGKLWCNKAGVINDQLGQTHSHASSEHCSLLFCFSRFEKWGRTYGRTTCAKTMSPTGRDFGLAEWIKKIKLVTTTSTMIITGKKSWQKKNEKKKEALKIRVCGVLWKRGEGEMFESGK